MSRHVHGMDELHHFGLLSLSRIVLSDAIGGHAAGTSIEEVLDAMYTRLEAAEGANSHAFASFTVDARVSPRFTIDAEILGAVFYEDDFDRSVTDTWGTATQAGATTTYGPLEWRPFKFDSTDQGSATFETIYSRMAVAETSFFRDEETTLYLPGRPYWRRVSAPNFVSGYIEGASMPSLATGEFILDFYHIFAEPYDTIVTFQSRAHGRSGHLEIFTDQVEYEVEGEFGWYDYYLFYGSTISLGPIPFRSSAVFVGGDDGDYGTDYEVAPVVMRVKGEWAQAGGTGRLKYWFPDTEDEPDWMATETVSGLSSAFDRAPSIYMDYGLLARTDLFPDTEVGGISLIRVDTEETDWKVYRQVTFDAIIERGRTGSFTANAVIAFGRVFFIDAVKEKVTSASFTANAVVANHGFLADAIVEKTQSATRTANAVIQKEQGASFVVDAIVLGHSFTVDAIVMRIWGAMPTIDAFIVSNTTFGFSADSVIERTWSASWTTDSVIKKSAASSITADAYIDDADDGFTLGDGTLGDMTLGG